MITAHTDFKRHDVHTLDELRAGEWTPVTNKLKEKLIAIIRCPRCNDDQIVSRRNHSVSENGIVTPSFICRMPGCNFHEFISLENWNTAD